MAQKPTAKKNVAEDPRYTQALQSYELGLRAMQEHKFDKAKPHFQKVAAGPSKELIDRANVHLNICNQHLERTASTQFKTAEEHFDYAVSLMNVGDYVTAREHLEKLLKQNARADYVVYGLAALDCLTGHVEDSLKHLDEALRLNAQLRFQARNDSDFWQWTAEKRRSRQEWEAIRERSMNRQADLRALGKLSGGAIPFGYDVYGDKFAKTLKPNDIGREYVPQIFRRVARGESLLKVAQWLDSQGVKPRYGEKWSAVSVSQIIRNHTYVGQRKADAYVNGKRRRGQGMIRLEVEAIVEAGIFLAANSRLKNAKRGGRRGPKNWEPALLTGVLRCGNCGAPMYRLKVRGGYVYYRCHGHLPQPKGCGTLVTASLLDSEVDKIMRTNEIWVHEWTFEAGEESQIRAAIDNIRLKLGDLPTQGLSDDDEDAERAKLRAQRNQLESQIDSATPDHWAKSVVTKKDGTPLTEAERWRDADQDGRREILKDYRITFKWDQLDGTREPAITVVPLWAETGKDDQS